MQDFPHHYRVDAQARQDGPVELSADQLPVLSTAPPAQFGGPGDQWSPEDLLVGSVANCFILTFTAIARASRFEWSSLECSVEGTLERVERVTQFTAFRITATLRVPPGSDDAGKAEKLMEKAERDCLITNSLKAESTLEAAVETLA